MSSRVTSDDDSSKVRNDSDLQHSKVNPSDTSNCAITGAIHYTLNNQGISSDESSEEGPDVYIPSFSIPSIDVSHGEIGEQITSDNDLVIDEHKINQAGRQIENESSQGHIQEDKDKEIKETYTSKMDRNEDDLINEVTDDRNNYFSSKNSVDVGNCGIQKNVESDSIDKQKVKWDLDHGNKLDLDHGNKLDLDHGNKWDLDHGNKWDLDHGNKDSDKTEEFINKELEKKSENEIEVTQNTFNENQPINNEDSVTVVKTDTEQFIIDDREENKLNQDGLGKPCSSMYEEKKPEHFGKEPDVKVKPSPPSMEESGNLNRNQWGQIPNIQPVYPYYNMAPMMPGFVNLNRPQHFPPYPLVQPHMAYQVPYWAVPRMPRSLSVETDASKGDNSANLPEFQPKSPNTKDPHLQKDKMSEKTPKYGRALSENDGDLYPDLNAIKEKSKEKEIAAKDHHGRLYPDIPPLKDEEKPSVVEKESTTIYSRQQGSKIVITFTGNISEHTLIYYFENTRKSGGGDIEKIDFSPDTGLAVIEYKEEDSAVNVWKKNPIHIVSGVNLNIHVIQQEADMGRVIEENMVFVRGINRTTTKDCLMDYMEVKAGYEPTDMRYGSDKNCALIVFEDKVDFLALQLGCEKKPLEGSFLTVSRVPVTSSILITGLNPSTTRETVQYYFENERRSGGSEDLEIVHFDGNSCVIRFTSVSVAKRVCDWKKQKIDNYELEVSMYYEFLGRKEIIKEIPSPEIITADSNILKFLKNSDTPKNDFEMNLKSLNAHVEWAKDFDKDETKVLCDIDLSTTEGQEQVHMWKSKVTTFTGNYLSTMRTMRLTTLKEVWSDVLKELRTINISEPDKICVILEKANHVIVLVGVQNIVKDLCNDVQKIISCVEGKYSGAKQAATKMITFKIFILQLLWRLKYFDMVNQKFPGVFAKYDLDKREVTLSGDADTMSQAELFLRETASSFVRKPFRFSRYKKDLLFKKGSRETWFHESKIKQITATWNIDRGNVCEMYAQTEKDVDRAIVCITDLFLEDEFVVEESFDNFIKSSKWLELQQKLDERDENCFVIKTEGRRIQLAAAKYIFHDIKADIEKEIDAFTELHCRNSKTVDCNKGLYLYLTLYCQKEIQNIESSMKGMEVKINSDKQNYCYEINGNSSGVSQASKKLAELINTVHSVKHKVDVFGIRQYFLSRPGKAETLDIAKKHSSVVLQDTDYSKDKAKRVSKGGGLKLTLTGVKTVFMHDQNHKVYLIEGDITKLEVDAIVNAANNDMDHCGGLAKAVVDAAGMSVQAECHRYTKKHGPVKDGDAIYSGPGRLPCKMIIHAVGPGWRGGSQGEEPALMAAVMACLFMTEKRGYETVAIPALSGGIFGYPLEQCTSVIVRTVKKYFEDNKSTSVKGVFLCDVSGETIKMFKSALQQAYHPESTLEPLKYPHPTEPGMAAANHGGYPEHSDDRVATAYDNKYPADTEPTKAYGDRSHEDANTLSTKDDFIHLIKGLLTHRQVDMIVNSMSKDLDLSHGRLSKSVLEAAGEQIQTEIYQHIDSFKPYQTIALTSGGKMKCHMIPHGVLAPFDGLDSLSTKILCHFLDQCLMAASDKGFQSIAFPAIGTGVLNFPADIVAKLMFEGVLKFKAQLPDSSLKRVEFVIYPKDTAAVKAFEDEFMKITRKSVGLPDRDAENMAQAPVDNPKESKPRTRKGRNQTTRLGEIHVLIRTGDITKEDTDVIVNCTSKSLDLSKGAVSKAILTAAGSDLQKELRQAADNAKDADLIVTSGGRMKCKHIIHIMAQSSLSGWEAMVTKCLQEADQRKLSAISLPALGTGMKACRPHDVASAIFTAVKKFTPVQNVKQVTVVVFQREMAGQFITEIKKIAGDHKHRDSRSEDYSDNKRRHPDKDRSKDEKNPDSIKFYIWSDSFDNIKAVKKDLDKVAEEQCYKKPIHGYGKVVHNLKNNQKFKDIEKQYKVKITVDKDVVEILGPPDNVSKATDAINTYLRSEETCMVVTERAKDIANYIQWHYKDPSSDKFKPFKLEDNYLIETEYKKKSPTVKIKDGKGVTYQIDFQKMEESPVGNPGPKIPVQRKQKEREKGVVNLPPNWSPMKPDQKFHEQQLHPGHSEYERVKTEFQKSGGTVTIVKIYRVQNPMLYIQYAAKRKELWNQNKKNPEKWLWHGTSADTVNKVIHSGFNRSYCGKNGTAYGNGVYFAVNAGYSVGYSGSGDNHGNKHMFSAQVLTGDTVSGNGGMVVLPPKPGHNLITYDSACDSPSNPVMFIIFHDSQAYPTYHILFK